MAMRRFVILFLSLLASVNAWAWGAKGHDVTAYIAECNQIGRAHV